MAKISGAEREVRKILGQIAAELDAETLQKAWIRYVEAFGEPPHGTLPQLRALLSLIPSAGEKP